MSLRSDVLWETFDAFMEGLEDRLRDSPIIDELFEKHIIDSILFRTDYLDPKFYKEEEEVPPARVYVEVLFMPASTADARLDAEDDIMRMLRELEREGLSLGFVERSQGFFEGED